MNADKVIHEALGLCWHTYGRADVGGLHKCKNCGHIALCTTEQTDYTDPVHYCALMDWMREGYRADHFYDWLPPRTDRLNVWIKTPRKKQVTLIAEAIEAGVLS